MLLLVILIGLTVIGQSFSKRYKDKLLFFKDMNAFCNVLENQIQFQKSSLQTIVTKHEKEFYPHFASALQNYFVLRQPFKEVSCLNQKENAFVKNFFESLGKLNTLGEKNNILHNKQTIAQFIEEKTQECNRYAPLGTKLGFLGGLLVCVLLL